MKKKKKKKYRLDGFHVALVKEALFFFCSFVCFVFFCFCFCFFLASIFSACQKDFQFACSRKRSEKEKKGKKNTSRVYLLVREGVKRKEGILFEAQG